MPFDAFYNFIRRKLLRASPMRCPYCCEILRDETAKAASFHCVRQQSAARLDEIRYAHPEGPSVGGTGWVDLSSFPVNKSYLTDARRGRIRFVSVLGLKTAGKTTWLQSLGASTLYPHVGKNHCYGMVPCSLMNAAGAEGDPALLDSQALGLGELPASTDLRGRPPTYMLAAGPGRLRHFVLKDIAGEALMQGFAELLRAPDKRHLITSTWHLFIINASNPDQMSASLAHAVHWIDEVHCSLLATQANQPGRPGRPPRALVMFAQCDSPRCPARLVEAVNLRPNRIHLDDGPPPTVRDYMEGMAKADRLARAELKERAPKLFDLLVDTRNFASLRVGACSALGSAPVAFAAGEDSPYLAACATQPALVRVVDPILWMLRDEKLI